MKILKTLSLLALISVSSMSIADFSVGLMYGKSEPKNYDECPCPPTFELQPIEASFDTNVYTLSGAYRFKNGLFGEFRYSSGSGTGESTVDFRNGVSFRGVDVELNHLSNLSLGYRFFEEEAFSPYIMVGNTFNTVFSVYTQTGEFLEKQNISNQVSYGAGIDWSASENIDIRLDYQQYSSASFGDVEKIDLSVLSIAAVYNF